MGFKRLLSRAESARLAMNAAALQARQRRGAYHAAITDLARAGLSVRDIGKALGMSHQRVHQILTGTVCSFCGSPRHAVTKMIAGAGGQPGWQPGRARRLPPSATFVCDRCIRRASEAFRTRSAVEDDAIVVTLLERDSRPCNFCGARVGEPAGSGIERNVLAACGDARICQPCVELCADILEEEWKNEKRALAHSRRAPRAR